MLNDRAPRKVYRASCTQLGGREVVECVLSRPENVIVVCRLTAVLT